MFSNCDINKFMLLFRKGAYPYNYMNDWKMINEIALPEKEKFNNNLNMENLQMQMIHMPKELIKTLE